MSKVLIVDDSNYIRRMLNYILTDGGYEVVGEAADGTSAFEIIKNKNPDFVFLDMILPDCSGLDILKKIKMEYAKSKVVMISAIENSTIIEEAMLLGASGYISKPFSSDQILKYLKKYSKKRPDIRPFFTYNTKVFMYSVNSTSGSSTALF